MGLRDRIERAITERIIDVITPKLKEMLIEFVYRAQDFAKGTPNTIDDAFIAALMEEFNIPPRPEEPQE